MNKNIFKSIGAILAGMLTNIILSVITDTALEKAGIFTPPEQGFFTPWMVITAFLYRCVYTVAGGYVTARLAPNLPMQHAKILGIIGLALSIVGIVMAWNLSPHWYPIALAVVALPLTLYGASLYKEVVATR